MVGVKKATKKAAALVLALMMVAVMGVTAFAASTGAYSVTLYSSSGSVAPHNPLTGADLVDNGDGTVTLSLYAEEISVEIESTGVVVTGYLDSLSVEGVTGKSVAEATDESGNTYTTQYTFELDEDVVYDDNGDLVSSLNITYTLSYASHVDHSGSISLTARS
ncbi:MAG: hypothetical protein LUE92_03790 [Clostridiales bacterium]|nr:hypothetical protein [Clostridiales bacterium]